MELNISQTLVASFESLGVKDAFIVTGGAISGFTEALADSSISVHYMLTEQSAAIAAESYGHFDGHPALLVVTSGPGVSNALTGVAAAWTNSSPVIVVSGQARTIDLSLSGEFPNRQWGSQHLNTKSIVESFSKLTIEPMATFDGKLVAQQLVHVATAPRMGPVWLSFPSDLQRAINGETEIKNVEFEDFSIDEGQAVRHALSGLQRASKPLILLGNGVRGNNESVHLLEELSARVGIALLTTWTGLDLIPDACSTYFGRPGTISSGRVANIAVQEADFILILGARLDLSQIGFRPNDFALQAEVVRVDIDEMELLRIPPRKTWTNYVGDAVRVLDVLIHEAEFMDLDHKSEWISHLSKLRNLPTGRGSSNLEDGISTYAVVAQLDNLDCKFVVLGSSGTCVEMVLQSWRVSKNQRFLNSGGLGSMGFALAGAIGVAKKTKSRVLAIESDGSFAMNIQDLETIAREKLNIKIVVLDSSGYKSIKLSQKRQGQSEHGTSPANGLFLPISSKWARASGIQTCQVETFETLSKSLEWLMDSEEPRLVQIMVSESEEAVPRLISKLNKAGRMETSPFTELWPSLDA